MGRSERIEIIRKIEEARGSKVFCLLTSDRPNLNVQLQKDILPRFVNQLRKNGEFSKIDLFIFTHGGDTLAGFGLSRLLREYADTVNTLVPDCCHSAGTLIAIGCDRILMTKAATLSPIDPSIIRPLNPAVKLNPALPPQLTPLSVESVAGFQGLMKNEWKVRGANNVTSVLRLLSDKVHPLALGDVYRARQQIELLASKLLKQHRDDERRIRRIVRTLTKELGSHDYLIYRQEAINLLGQQIETNQKVEDLVWDLYMDFSAEMELGVPFDPNIILARTPLQPPRVPNAPNTRTVSTEIQLAVVESLVAGDRAVKRMNITETQVMQPQGGVGRQVGPVVDTFAGWESYS